MLGLCGAGPGRREGGLDEFKCRQTVDSTFLNLTLFFPFSKAFCCVVLLLRLSFFEPTAGNFVLISDGRACYL